MSRVYLLAAGRGKRAGGPKAWRDWNGTALLAAQLEFFSDLVGARNVSVSIQDPWLARCVVIAPLARYVSVDPDLSPLASLQTLWKDRPSDGYVLHVDMPVFDRSVWDALKINGVDSVPVFNGRRGHPVYLSKETLSKAAVLDARTERLDHFLRTQALKEVAVQTESILSNFNGVPA